MNLQEIRAGNRRSLARFLTLVENHREQVAAAITELCAVETTGYVIGLTGPPGSGKSALVTALTKALRKGQLRVAIVAVDPTSPFTGGALLGDRIRMRALAGDDGVFIRSMASRGSLGGLAWRTQDIVRVLLSAGFDRVIVETVGAGQSEVDIAGLAPTTVVVQAPGAGDALQATKAGILEIADVFAVNKCDLPGAAQVKRALQAALELGHSTKPNAPDGSAWVPPIVCTSAINDTGVDDLVQCLEAHQKHMASNGLLDAFREAQVRVEFMQRLQESVRSRLFDTITEEELTGIIKRTVDKQIDPQRAVDQLLEAYEIRRLI